jgi:hypothetical protein
VIIACPRRCRRRLSRASAVSSSGNLTRLLQAAPGPADWRVSSQGSPQCGISAWLRSGSGLVSRVSPVQTALRNYTRDEGRSFEVGNQVWDLKPPQAAVVSEMADRLCDAAWSSAMGHGETTSAHAFLVGSISISGPSGGWADGRLSANT